MPYDAHIDKTHGFKKGDRVWVVVSYSGDPLRRIKGTFDVGFVGDGAFYVQLDGDTRPGRWNWKLVSHYTVLDALVEI